MDLWIFVKFDGIDTFKQYFDKLEYSPVREAKVKYKHYHRLVPATMTFF